MDQLKEQNTITPNTQEPFIPPVANPVRKKKNYLVVIAFVISILLFSGSISYIFFYKNVPHQSSNKQLRTNPNNITSEYTSAPQNSIKYIQLEGEKNTGIGKLDIWYKNDGTYAFRSTIEGEKRKADEEPRSLSVLVLPEKAYYTEGTYEYVYEFPKEYLVFTDIKDIFSITDTESLRRVNQTGIIDTNYLVPISMGVYSTLQHVKTGAKPLDTVYIDSYSGSSSAQLQKKTLGTIVRLEESNEGILRIPDGAVDFIKMIDIRYTETQSLPLFTYDSRYEGDFNKYVQKYYLQYGFVSSGSDSHQRDAKRKKDTKLLINALVAYYFEKNNTDIPTTNGDIKITPLTIKYVEPFNRLVPEVLIKVPLDPLPDSPYIYNVTDKIITIKAKLENKEECNNKSDNPFDKFKSYTYTSDQNNCYFSASVTY